MKCLKNLSIIQLVKLGECSICWEEIEPKKLCVTPCAHIFCFDCLIPYIRQSEKCPLCRAECSYAHILSKLFRIPELAIVLKRLINVSRQEEWIEEVEEEEIEEEEESIEDDRTIIYHVNIYIIMQKNLENLHSFVTIFVAVFFSYYYYLLFLRKGLQLFNLCINVISIFWVIYYALS